MRRKLLRFAHQSLAGDAFYSLSGAVVTRGSVFLLQVLIARQLSVEMFTEFVTASSVGVFAAAISDLGLSNAVVVLSRGDRAVCLICIRQVLAHRLVGFVAATLLGTLVVVFVLDIPLTQSLFSFVIVSSYTLYFLSRYFRSVLLTDLQLNRLIRFEIGERLLSFVLAVGGIVYGSPLLLALGFCMGSLLAVVRSWHSIHIFPSTDAVPSIPTRQRILRLGMTMALSNAGSLLSARFDLLIIAKTRSTAEVAIYGASYNVLLAASLMSSALAHAALSHLPTKGPGTERSYVRMAFAVGGFGFFLIASTGPLIVKGLFDLDADVLQVLFVILAAAFFFEALTSTLVVIAPLKGMQNRLVASVWVSVVANAIACLLLIPRLGVIGGAIATWLGYVCVCLGWGRRWPSMSHSQRVKRRKEGSSGGRS
jgi:O-antigen/teichoic acid export membrane protein